MLVVCFKTHVGGKMKNQAEGFHHIAVVYFEVRQYLCYVLLLVDYE